MSDRRPIIELPRILNEAGFESATYRQLYLAAVNGRFPAKRASNGRWSFDVADLPEIAEAMGLCDAHAA